MVFLLYSCIDATFIHNSGKLVNFSNNKDHGLVSRTKRSLRSWGNPYITTIITYRPPLSWFVPRHLKNKYNWVMILPQLRSSCGSITLEFQEIWSIFLNPSFSFQKRTQGMRNTKVNYPHSTTLENSHSNRREKELFARAPWQYQTAARLPSGTVSSNNQVPENVGKLKPITDLLEEYQRGSKVIKDKIRLLGVIPLHKFHHFILQNRGITHFRYIRGDGNCFYRSITVGVVFDNVSLLTER